jgi:hypothetical protein
MSPEDSNEERFARQDSRRYSGWSAAITIAVIVIVLVILIVVYQLSINARQASGRP